jgi:hypothetical protein
MMTTDLNSSNSIGFMMDAALTDALGYMQRPIACPEDVKARIAALRVPADEVTGTRINTNWRSGNSGGPQRNQGWGNRPGYNWQTRAPQNQNQNQPMAPRRPYIDRALAPRFGNKSRADVTTEERMMDRIRDKMNKFSALTYDATKAWLSQLLDSGETGFLTDFITLVFEKAAAEEPFCALYARLITELCAGFPHLRVELHRIFDEFIDIFAEAADEPDVGAAEYKAFLALRERRRYRRGYATFVGEIAKLNVLTIDDITRTCNIILNGFASAKVKEDQGMLCEEYADCLTSLVKRCMDLLRPSLSVLLTRVKEVMDRTDSPSLTNKARFALMDVVDLFN